MLRMHRYNTQLPTVARTVKMKAVKLASNHFSRALTTTMIIMHGTPQILDHTVCHVLPLYNLVKSASARLIPTATLKKPYIRLRKSMKKRVGLRHVITMMLQRRLSSRQQPSTAAISVQQMGSQSLQRRRILSNWHGRTRIRNLECHPWH